MYDDGDDNRAVGMNKYNDNGDLIEYDVSGAGWVVMGPDDPIAILVGHQGLTWRKEMFLKLVGRFWNKVGGEVISVAKTIPQSGLCSSMCLTCMPASSVKTMQTKTPLSKSTKSMWLVIQNACFWFCTFVCTYWCKCYILARMMPGWILSQHRE